MRIMLTKTYIEASFRALGVQAGMTLLVHSSMKSLGGWVVGGAETIIEALQAILTPDGTLMMPAHTADNTNPQYWENPPVPAEWWPTIRAEMPPFHPIKSTTWNMGIIAESFRLYPDVLRSNHPVASFAAWGKHAHHLTVHQRLEAMFGEDGPIGRFYELGGTILLLGVGHGNNTSIHLAEHRATCAKVMISEGSAVTINGQREWVSYIMLDYDESDFERIGQAYEAAHHPFLMGKVGESVTRLVPMRPLVDFATIWMSENRRASE